MIGLTALAIAALWCFLGFQLARRLPKWLGIKKPAVNLSVSVALFAVFMVGPFVDHIVGMWQFEKLCDEQTGVWISPDAKPPSQTKYVLGRGQSVSGTAIAITKYEVNYVDTQTSRVLASYTYFSTPGGVVGGPLTKFGGQHTCSAEDSSNPNFHKLMEFKNQFVRK